MGRPLVERTCLGCRTAAAQMTLVRFRPDPGRHSITIDRDGTVHGRSAYVHPTTNCLSRAVKRVQASLKLVDPVDLVAVREIVMSVVQQSSVADSSTSIPRPPKGSP